MPKAMPLKRNPRTKASQGVFLVRRGRRGFMICAICSNIGLSYLGWVGRPRGLPAFGPLLDTQQHLAFHDEVGQLHQQGVRQREQLAWLSVYSRPENQPRGPLGDLLKDERPAKVTRYMKSK